LGLGGVFEQRYDALCVDILAYSASTIGQLVARRDTVI